jgi:hypothetical protein
MNKEELQAIKERCEKATPGPWEIDENLLVSHNFDENYCEYVSDNWDKDNAEFIAHAREDIPLLLVEINGLTAELESETAWAKEYFDLAENRLKTIEGDRKKMDEWIAAMSNSVFVEKKAKEEIERLTAENELLHNDLNTMIHKYDKLYKTAGGSVLDRWKRG